MKFTASKETIEKLSEGLNGFVYVFSKNDFQQKGGSQYVCAKNIKPIDFTVVKFSDFKQPIKIKEKNQV